MAAASTPTIDWNDVQGMVLRGYGKYPYAANLFLQVDDEVVARRWLSSLCGRITSADRAIAQPQQFYCNVAFTRAGLAHWGLTDATLKSFPTAFIEGPASSNRSRILGDVDLSEPKNWTWGGAGDDIHAILMIFAMQAADLAVAVQAERTNLQGVSLKFEPIDTQLADDRKEHFGFRDGISQPVIRGSPPPRAAANPAADPVYADANLIQAGEFLLGYLNEYNVLPDSPDMPTGSDPQGILPTVKTAGGAVTPDLGHNGSFLVVRQVAQHVPQLWTYLDGATKNAAGQSRPDERGKLAAKLIGRWQGGAPVTISPDHDDASLSNFNDFVYKASPTGHAQQFDPDGFGCPFGAHIRRANPRDTLGDDPAEAIELTKRHRLIRRGRSYGPRAADPLDGNDTQERGLLFMCINANIERQFEFVQQTWINNPSFHGLYNERDPIFGDASSGLKGTMTIPRLPIRRQLTGLGGFITVRGAAYFFMPSIKALRYLALAR